MQRRHHPGGNDVGKDVAAPAPRQVLVKSGDLAEPTAQDDHVGVEEVDHHGEASRQAILIKG